MNQPEWGFSEPPEQVDLQKIMSELSGHTAIKQYAYLEQLYKHAPKTYARLRQWRKSVGCTKINWDYDPHGRFSSSTCDDDSGVQAAVTAAITIL